jgi:hypothetical protein
VQILDDMHGEASVIHSASSWLQLPIQPKSNGAVPQAHCSSQIIRILEYLKLHTDVLATVRLG